MHGRLFVPHVDDADAFVDAAVVERHDVTARKSKDNLDPGILQCLGRKLSAVKGHGGLSSLRRCDAAVTVSPTDCASQQP